MGNCCVEVCETYYMLIISNFSKVFGNQHVVNLFMAYSIV
jgi:hypothetical protein